jgi:mannose-1-phosphate guanylyltransferase
VHINEIDKSAEVEMMEQAGGTWSIVLAGGQGVRTRAFIDRWLGSQLPKQYCTFVGRRSLLQHTVDRADRISPATKRLTIVARDRHEVAVAQLAGRGGHLLFQPGNRGTAAGVFLPLSRIRAVDPAATVVIYPADHFVWPEQQFEHAIRQAIEAGHAAPDHPILFGVVPDSAEGDYGWIVRMPGSADCETTRPIQRFREKPATSEAATLLRAGGLWNTLVMVARVETLWEMGRQHLSDLVDRFDTWRPLIGTRHEAEALDTLYGDMPVQDFSRDLLERTATQWRAFELRDVLWSDWGRPERIIQTLLTIGRVPAFCGRSSADRSTLTGEACLRSLELPVA